MKMVSGSIKPVKFTLASPMNLSYWWNMGSLLGMLVVIQVLSGLLLVFYYDTSDFSFFSLWFIHLEVYKGYLIHLVHLNYSNFIFVILYLHMMKGLIFGSFLKLKMLWISGWTLMLLMMMIAFMGYVLPWGQMSLWGATVIINLLSALPYGSVLVKWVWGGYFVSNLTLKLFFTLHFLVPFILIILIMLHIIMLHYSGSSNPIGSGYHLIKWEFSPFYIFKDMTNIIIILVASLMVMCYPYIFADPDNFILSDSSVSPIHIKPEWYFLHYYAILRATPNKLGGVILFMMSLILLLQFIFWKNFENTIFSKIWILMIISFVTLNLGLMWLGGSPVEYPYLFLSQIFSGLYFLFFFMFHFYFI